MAKGLRCFTVIGFLSVFFADQVGTYILRIVNFNDRLVIYQPIFPALQKRESGPCTSGTKETASGFSLLHLSGAGLESLLTLHVFHNKILKPVQFRGKIFLFQFKNVVYCYKTQIQSFKQFGKRIKTKNRMRNWTCIYQHDLKNS